MKLKRGDIIPLSSSGCCIRSLFLFGISFFCFSDLLVRSLRVGGLLTIVVKIMTIGMAYMAITELILMEKDYGKEGDIWSTGIIFGELLNTLEQNCPDFKRRKCLFPGKYCFPLSPNKNGDIDDIGIPISQKNDQLDLVFNMIGSPSADDMSFVTDEKAVKYLQKFTPRSPANLRERYPQGSDEALDLLT